MVSVIIAAYDEEAVLGATLDALRDDAPEAEVIVVPNGCSDRTADVARSRSGVRVIELAHGSKPHALNAGDAVATTYPRIYLDADIRVPRGAIDALVRALEQPGVLAAVPARRLDVEGRPWMVRAHSRVHERLPVFRDGLFGRGMIAVSEAGRSRFGSFPDMVADDLFLDSQFTSRERAHVDDVAVTVQTPTTTRELLDRLERVTARFVRHAQRGHRGQSAGDCPPLGHMGLAARRRRPRPAAAPFGTRVRHDHARSRPQGPAGPTGFAGLGSGRPPGVGAPAQAGRVPGRSVPTPRTWGSPRSPMPPPTSSTAWCRRTRSSCCSPSTPTRPST